jgi:hypothetical protein
MDVVFGGHHGVRRFHVVIKLKHYAVSMHVGNINCNKDTREILEKKHWKGAQ